MNTMKYKNYIAKIEFDEDDKIFVGTVIGIKDIICFDGTTVDELEKRFAESIDHYLVSCEKFGDNPQKPYSGKLMLRVDPQIHAAVAIASQIKGKSINQWASDVLEKAANG